MTASRATLAYPDGPRFLDSGEAALVVEFGRGVDPQTHERVLALDAALQAAPVPGLRESVPTYRSLMLHYDPLTLPRADLVAHVHRALETPAGMLRVPERWTLPCCYAPPFGEDVAEMAEKLGITPEAAVQYHQSAMYRIYMYGFAPGFTYLGGLHEAIAVSRRATPRPPHAAGAVLVGGGLAAVATFPMPTGWYVVGQTPERLYAPEREKAFLMEPGDEIRFLPVDAAEFAALQARALTGEIVARKEPL
jgi:inhibitor of KinA